MDILKRIELYNGVEQKPIKEERQADFYRIQIGKNLPSFVLEMRPKKSFKTEMQSAPHTIMMKDQGNKCCFHCS